jgi:hypothetical protein
VLNYSSDGSVRSWDYNPETARIELCHLIARLDLPLGIGAYDAFVEYIRRAHNPRYAPICRQTIYDTTYPVLSILAKEVMTMSILTISSEFTFSLVGRIIEERRRSLTSNMVEMISCLKDWELGAARQQHEVENEEVLSAFAELFIDEDQATASAAGGGGGVQWDWEWLWTIQVRVDCCCTLFLSRGCSCSRYKFLLRKVFNEGANA